ncbi:hypothetical protein HYDPIDRAFT_30729 [Hydnomerulius pinastri MD-312]|uniref:Uncharacterized protein n=1 Tax=Hydnomerulius pinastri MD-312 TaxID=994086 RepID=A0A0C9WD62_9AGAM|nr:hypothetical protein HYDPIDRAFT_30729 [Hydnomerulius pinastri MD-312]
MSSPIVINYSSTQMYEPSSSPSSPGLYVPLHRRNRSSGVPSSYNYSTGSSRASSPTLSTSSRSVSPLPHVAPITDRDTSLPIYTPADLLLLSASPLAKLSPEHSNTLRAVAPEVVQSRKQRKAQEWRARHPGSSSSRSHKRTSSDASHTSHSSESEEGIWRRV